MKMKFSWLLTIVMPLLWHQTLASNSPPSTAHPTWDVIKAPGTYQSKKGNCSFSLAVSNRGFMQLLVASHHHQQKIVNDVTGVSYLTDSHIVFTTSPIYGSPGVYTYNCNSRRTRQIVRPKTLNSAYPEGADYFELHHVDKNKIYFYYSTDVDNTDFAKFRSSEFLFEVLTNGTAMQKTP